MIDVRIHSETLAPTELADITGSRTARGQLEWLDANGWPHHKNRAGAPIVGRWYAPGRDNATGGGCASVVA